LIELLVVIGMILVLATLALLVAPRVGERQRTATGAAQLQGTLFAAKQRAYRDRLVRGVRLLPNTASPAAVPGPGPAAVTPTDMTGIHPGMLLLIDHGRPGQEAVTVQETLPPGSPAPAGFATAFTRPHPPGFRITAVRATELKYLEQPDNFTAGWVSGSADGAGPTGTSTLTITFPAGTRVDLTGLVTVGQDYLYLRGGTEVHRILGVTAPRPAGPPPGQTTCTVTVTPLASPVPDGSQVGYWIERAPRPLAGEPIVNLPRDVAVDFFPTGDPRADPPYVLDVLFTPSGSVRQTGPGLGKYLYWVRNATLDSPFQGEPTLIAVYVTTGAVAAHPVNADDRGNPGPGGYYSFTRDGRDSGM
jgi:type II secretory pathway pseudopilin PulG